MSQFTNMYNGQNGISPSGGPPPYPSSAWQPDGRGQGSSNNGNMNPGYSAMGTAQQQGWKTYTPEPQFPPLVGRWVKQFDDIKPQDVPMDGSICFFPQADYSCIYAMVWSNDGKIVPYRFVPEKNEPPRAQQQALPVEINDILKGYESIAYQVSNRLETLELKFGEMYNLLTASTATQSAKPSRNKSNTKDEEEK